MIFPDPASPPLASPRLASPRLARRLQNVTLLEFRFGFVTATAVLRSTVPSAKTSCPCMAATAAARASDISAAAYQARRRKYPALESQPPSPRKAPSPVVAASRCRRRRRVP